MANFIRNKYNSLDEQVEENKHNIDELINIIKEPYTAHVDLGDSSITVLISDTNASNDVVEGWLFSQDGYLYKINGGDGTNLLIEFYAQIKGDEGPEGPEGPEGQEGPSGADGSNGYNFRYFNGNYVDDLTSYSYNDLTPSLSLKAGDEILFYDGTIARLTTYNNLLQTFTVTKIGDVGFGGGGQLYQHNIYWKYTSLSWEFFITILSSDNTPFTKNSIIPWLASNGFTSSSNICRSGKFRKTSNSLINFGWWKSSDTSLGFLDDTGTSNTFVMNDAQSFEDKVITI